MCFFQPNYRQIRAQGYFCCPSKCASKKHWVVDWSENNIYHLFGSGHRYIDPGMSSIAGTIPTIQAWSTGTTFVKIHVNYIRLVTETWIHSLRQQIKFFYNA